MMTTGYSPTDKSIHAGSSVNSELDICRTYSPHVCIVATAQNPWLLAVVVCDANSFHVGLGAFATGPLDAHVGWGDVDTLGRNDRDGVVVALQGIHASLRPDGLAQASFDNSWSGNSEDENKRDERSKHLERKSRKKSGNSK